jgi:phage/plasmid-like protein (TIGR03299 family)
VPDYFDQGFSVRQPMWHGMGIILQDYPGREEAMRLAGHDFNVIERPVYAQGKRIEGWKALFREDEYRTTAPPTMVMTHPDHGEVEVPMERYEEPNTLTAHEAEPTILNVVRESYGVVQNEVGWDIVDAMVGEGAQYETGITLKDGAVCSVLAWLDEPVTIPGDDSEILPWLNVSWSHDGSASLACRPTSIRTVCWNTQSAAEAYGRRPDTEFTFRHSKNVMARIEDAKMAIRGVRAAHEEYIELARELADIPVTADQRYMFVAEMIPMPPEALISKRVKSNVDGARAQLGELFAGQTIPDAHRFTAYGLHLAGGEYLDHLRGYRSSETYFGRSMLRREPAKARMTGLIREVVKA